MIVAILIGRERSTGFPGKNVTPVLGKPSTLHIEQHQTMFAPQVGYAVFTRPTATVHAIAGLR